ncbi:MAG: YbjQ family protein [Candidatus Woesearchaeota archaeon]|nr:MAG: YbjQ family protein [Candidatus Woesearchaeota archaeon]
MIITTTETIPGKKATKILGVVRGSTIRAKHIGRDIMAGFKTLIGGEIKSYTSMINEAREEALDRMIAQAKELNADAIICMRLVTAEVMPGAAEVLAYGTAVKLQR